MIKNRAAKALIIVACFTFGTSMGVFADTNDLPVKPVPAIIEEVTDESLMMTTQIQLTSIDDALLQKQKEIDEYVFEKHQKELEQKGFIVAHTAVVGDVVEVGIAPYSTDNADYLYEIFGKEQVSIVDGQLAVPLEQVTITADKAPETKDTSLFETIVNSIIEWFKSIF